MDLKIGEIQPLTDGTLVPNRSAVQNEDSIQSVGKTEQSGGSHVKNDNENGQSNNRHGNLDLKTAQKLAEEVQGHLNDLNIQLNFKVQSKTGQVIVQVINRDTDQVIRQIPPERLVHLREKLEELQGVLFNDKT